jgi:thymidylate synthase (FAD)
MQCEYIDHMGTDLTVSNSARVSFSKESVWDLYTNDKNQVCKILSEKDKKLIRYLSRNGHWTPFSHPQITLRETVPIFVARQRFKHMIGFAYNEISRRYVDDLPEFFFPETWRTKPDGSIKQGSGNVHHNTHEVMEQYRQHMRSANSFYTWLIKEGVAPEQARMVLPQSMYTSYYVTGSLAAWARAYKLRIDGHAQKEIQDLAKRWDAIIRPLFPVSWAALTDN